MSDRESELGTEASLGQVISEDLIANYLTNHPKFFDRYPSVLFNKSLVQENNINQNRQIRLIQAELVEAQKKVKSLYMLAKQNEQLNQLSSELVKAIVQAKSLSQLEKNLQQQLEPMSLKGQSKLYLSTQMTDEPCDFLPEVLKDSIALNQVSQVWLSSEQIDFVFSNASSGQQAQTKIWSIPLVQNGQPLGVWVLSIFELDVYERDKVEQLLDFVSLVLIQKLDQLKGSVS